MSIQPTSQDTDLLLEETALTRKPIISIKICLLLMMSMMILTTLVVTSVIWLSSFASTVEVMAKELTEHQFAFLVQQVNNTLSELIISSETSKNQMKIHLNQNTTDYDQINLDLLQFVKSETKLHPIVEAVKLYNYDGYGNGFVTPKIGIRPFILITTRSVWDTYYMCDFEASTVVCPVYMDQVPKFETTLAKQIASNYLDTPIFTQTFSSPGVPVILISLINSFKIQNSTRVFDWMHYMDFSTSTFSYFLKESTNSIPGAISFILEGTMEKKIVATNNPEPIPTETITANMETIVTVNNTGVRMVYNEIIQMYPGMMNILCNNMVEVNSASRRSSIFRLCTPSKIDWVIVFSVPQWNYVGNMVIAIICALIGNLLILLLGSGLGMYSSIRITYPFYNLIALFEMVSNMELDSLHVEPSRFSEVSQLQSHFLAMTKKINEYRSFIPAHLLASIDGEERNETEPIAKLVKAHSKFESRRSFSSVARESTRSSSFRGDSSIFRLGLINKDITFMRLYIENLNELFGNLNDVSQTLSEMFNIIQSWSSKSGCFMGNIENQCITFSWNSSFDCKDHSKKAADQTKLLIERAKRITSKVNLRFSMLTEKCSVGNVGTEKMKNFTIFGNYNTNLDKMIQQTIKLDIPNLVSESVYKENIQNFEFRYICEKEMVKDTDSFFSLSDKIKKKECDLYEMGNHMKVQMDEWMYELEEMEKKKREWASYNQGIDQVKKKDYENALSTFQDHLSKFPEDKPTKKMIKKCKKKLK